MKAWKVAILALCLGACNEAGAQSTSDPSVFTWARVYCTADNESHIAIESVDLDKTNFAPPAPPLYVGGGGAVTTTFFGGFAPGWGAGDRKQKIYHAAPAVQWWTILSGTIYVEASDGDSHTFRAGEVIHLEDTAPCKGHISHNMSDKAAFMQFVR